MLGDWPVEPPRTRWEFGDPAAVDPDEDLVGLGADLEPGTVLAAYRRGLFPMPLGSPGGSTTEPMGWWCPAHRGILELDAMVVARSLRRSCRDFEIRVDSAFAEVLDGCADPRRPQGWIDDRIRTAYRRLHELGWAHSVEAWRDGELAGGLYGLSIGGLFAGESMFHRVRDASKVALLALVDLLRDGHGDHRLVDVQWATRHLTGLGVVEIDRAAYLTRLPALLEVPLPATWALPRTAG